jgi:type IV pilus assembly protein PilC
MAAYSYRALTAEGMLVDGHIHAPDSTVAHEQLRTRGLLAQDLTELPAAGAQGARTALKKVKPKSLQIFSRQFATMIDAGVNVVASLVILEEQTTDKYLKQVLEELRADVEGGMPLSKGMSRHPKVFNRLYISMVEAGESSGTLAEVLDRVAEQIEKEMQIKRRVRGAMMYPTVVLAFATLVLTGMLMFLVPVFAGLFEELGGELPMLTQWVVAVSDLLKGYWFIIFPLVGLGVWGLRRWKKTDSGRQRWDAFKLRIPMQIGQVVRKVAMARFSRTLSTLVASGVDIIRSLEITGQTSGNWVVENALNEVRELVHEGVPMAEPLQENPVFPPMVSQMVKIGEETGELEHMLSKIADFYEDEVDAAIQALTSIIEPLMMILVGAMVGIIVIAMYLPMFKMLTLIE